MVSRCSLRTSALWHEKGTCSERLSVVSSAGGKQSAFARQILVSSACPLRNRLITRRTHAACWQSGAKKVVHISAGYLVQTTNVARSVRSLRRSRNYGGYLLPPPPRARVLRNFEGDSTAPFVDPTSDR